jgi:hypothetical protein
MKTFAAEHAGAGPQLVRRVVLSRQGLPPGAVRANRKNPQGWQWRDGNQRHWFPPDQLKLSQDGHCHVCVSPRTIPSGICIYLPEET